MLVLGLQLSVDRALALKNAETLIFIKRNTPQSVYLREYSLNGAILFICNNVGLDPMFLYAWKKWSCQCLRHTNFVEI